VGGLYGVGAGVYTQRSWLIVSNSVAPVLQQQEWSSVGALVGVLVGCTGVGARVAFLVGSLYGVGAGVSLHLSGPMIMLDRFVRIKWDRLLRYIVEPLDFFLRAGGSFLDAYVMQL